MGRHVVLSLFLVVSTTGCAAFSGAPPLAVKTSCSPEQAWEAALAGVSSLKIDDKDKEKGTITTQWAVMESGQLAGVFQRNANRERARFFLALDRHSDDVTISVRQTREYFSPMGVQSQSTRWRRMSPLAEEEHRVMQRISARLKEDGCAILP
ncbi:MAG: hypothetical protein OXU40_09845 [Nitrospira sp.]|nr:hypothetical protein [Nitrospira sp.]